MIPGTSAGSPTAIRHAQASAGGWMLEVIGASFSVDVVRVSPHPVERRLPEDRVADEAVRALRRQQRRELAARERPGSKCRHAIAAKHESQYHCQG